MDNIKTAKERYDAQISLYGEPSYKHCMDVEISDLRERIDELAAENKVLRGALREYMRAGVGNSTDWRIQISALQLATAALTK